MAEFDLKTAAGIDRAAAKLARSWSGLTRDDDARARAKALRDLKGVDWGNSTPKQRAAVIATATAAIGISTAALGRLKRSLKTTSKKMLRTVYRDQSRALGIQVAFSNLDDKFSERLVTSSANFITDEYGRRRDDVTAQARKIVKDGLDKGLGNVAIASDLSRMVSAQTIGRSKAYWRVTANAFVQRTRSFGQLSSFSQAGIESYIIEAIMDERTTEICRYLDGKRMSTSTSLAQFEEVDSGGDVKEVNPWVQQSGDTLFVQPGSTKQAVARIDEPGFGTQSPGKYTPSPRYDTDQKLNNLGLSFPPFHGLCRTTLVADIS